MPILRYSDTEFHILFVIGKTYHIHHHTNHGGWWHHAIYYYVRYFDTISSIMSTQFVVNDCVAEVVDNFLVHGLQNGGNHNFCNTTNLNFVFSSAEPHGSFWSQNNLQLTMEQIW